MKNKELGIVCCYFNPCSYKSKYNNFLKFYKSISRYVDRVLVVELIHSESTQILPEEVNSYKVESTSVLWHKENLLNLGIKRLLDENYQYIAWLDADVVFDDSFWVKDSIHCLNNYKLCQLFSQAEKIQPNGQSTFHSGCVRYWKETGNIFPVNTFYHTGYGWACRSECLRDCMLYDKSIMGGGDSLIWFGSFDGVVNIYELLYNHPIFKLDINGYIIDYLDWSERWGSIIQGDISYVCGGVRSLPHGFNSNKNYILRYDTLKKHNYNPKKDLTYNNGILECTNDKFQADINKYFRSRKEDRFSLIDKLSKFIDKKLLEKEMSVQQKTVNKEF